MARDEELYVVFTHIPEKHENYYFGTFEWCKAWEVMDSMKLQGHVMGICHTEDIETYEINNLPRHLQKRRK